MEFHDDLLYMTGYFDGGFAIFNPLTEQTFIPDSGLKGFGYQFIRVGNKLYIAGDFIMAGSYETSNIAKFDIETGTFDEPLEGLSAPSKLFSITSHNDSVHAVFEGGVISYNRTGEEYSTFTRNDPPTWIDEDRSYQSVLSSVRIGSFLAIGGNVLNVNDEDFFLYGLRVVEESGFVSVGHLLPNAQNLFPDPTRVTDMLKRDGSYVMVLRESGIIAYIPDDDFETEIGGILYFDQIQPTSASAQVLHDMEGILFLLSVDKNTIEIGRQLLEGESFRFNNDLMLNQDFKNDAFTIASNGSNLFIAGPILGDDPKQQSTVFLADLTSDIFDWTLILEAKEGKDVVRPLTIGTSPEGSDEFDVLLDRMAPPMPPEGAFDARISPDLLRDYRATTTSETIWEIPVVRSDQNQGPLALEWDLAQLSGVPGLLILDIYAPSDTTSINMRTLEFYEVDADEVTFIIRHLVESPLPVTYAQGWILAGSPQENPFNPFTSMNNVVNETLFGFNGAYTDETEMIAGQGYWLFTNDETSATFTPPFGSSIVRSLSEGWNLVSGIWYAIASANIADPDNIVVPGTLFSYNNGYTMSETIEPGKGYWLLAAESGTISMSIDPGAEAGKRVPTATTPEGFITFGASHGEGHTLTFAVGGDIESQNVVADSYRMPPMPPSGAFDIRFSNNTRIAEGIVAQLDVRNPTEDLTFSVEEAADQDRLSLELAFFYGSEDSPELVIELTPGEIVTVGPVLESGAELRKVITTVSGTVSIDDGNMSEIPAELRLDQNYPNPFNPTTSIRFALPSESNVNLGIFNLLGQQVASIVSDRMAAGVHVVNFDASTLSSGVYVYRLEADGLVLTRKMTLIK